jgi:hypothetical protein
LLAEALSRKLRRRVTLDEIGMAQDAADLDEDLVMPDNPDQLVQVLPGLWAADTDRRSFLLGTVPVAALAHPTLDWLLTTTSPGVSGHGSRKVGMSDVDAIRTTAAMFDGLDHRFGGAHARTAAVHYLSGHVSPLLSGSYSEATGAALFSAVAEFNRRVGWMAYDSGIHGLSRRYFLHALALARHAGDRLLGAGVLTAMSHQANYLGEHREALNLARAAEHGIQGHDQPRVQANVASMQARAAARIPGARRSCEDALNRAEIAWERRGTGDDPDWIGYFDKSELADEFAHCYRDLGDAERAHAYATQCLEAGSEEDYPRSRTFTRIVLATSLLDSGELEQACSIVIDTLPRLATIESARCVTYLRDFHARTKPYVNDPVVVDFTERAKPLLQGRHLASPEKV